MLGKVMKYEFKSSGRILLPLFGLGIGLTLLLQLLKLLSKAIWPAAASTVSLLANLLGFLLIIIIILLSFIMLIVRFYQSFVTNEGYLTFTLPVSIDKMLIGRLLVSLVFLMGTALVSIASLLILHPAILTNMSALGAQTITIFGTNTHTSEIPISQIPLSIKLTFFAMLAGLLVVSAINTLLHAYVAIAVGGRFGRSRIIASLLAYYVFNLIQSIVGIIPMAIVYFTSEKMRSWPSYLASLVEQSQTEQLWAILGFIGGIFAIASIATTICSIGYYFVTRYLFGKKLNLE